MQSRTVFAVVLSCVVWMIVLIYHHMFYGEYTARGIPRPLGILTRRGNVTGGITLFPSPPTQDAPKSLFIVAYHRSGSTFTASIFNAYPGSFYIFEPIFGMGIGQTIRFFNDTSVKVTKNNIRLLKRDMLTKILSCDLQNINTGLFYNEYHFVHHQSFKLFKTCLVSEWKKIQSEIRTNNGMIYSDNDLNYVDKMKAFKTKGYAQRLFFVSTLKRSNVSIRAQKRIKQIEKNCVLPVQQKCKISEFRVFKFIRVSFKDVEPFMRQFPGLKVVHLIRDPRGNAISQAAALRSWNKTKSIAQEYCTRVASNLRTAEKIANSFPNRVNTLAYENLSASPFEETHRVFDFLDLPFAPEVKRHLDRVAQGEKGKTTKDCLAGRSATYCVHKANATNIANQWKREIKKNQLDDIQAVCRDTMDMMRLKPVSFSHLQKQVVH